MSLYKFNTHPQPGYHDKDGKFVTADTQTALGSVHSNTNTATANFGSGSNPSGSMPGVGLGPSSGFSGSDNVADLYNPIRDRLDEGSIIEDWIPRDQSGLNEMFRLMYHRDPIAGTIVDLLAELIWSDFELTGISDPVIKSTFQDCLDKIDLLDVMPAITREYLVIGRSISSLMYDKSEGIFTDVVTHDPSFARLTPIPIKGYDPKIDIMPSPGVRAFMQSNDIRDINAREGLPQDYIKALMGMPAGSDYGGYGPASGYSSGAGANHGGGFGIPSTGGYGSGAISGIPLDPLTTVFLARRVFLHDYIGTSLYTRIINFWALEKALLNATMSHARRRVAPILHIKMGIDNIWEPTPDEISNVAGMFIQADQDPVGAMVATRTGIDVSEVRSGTDFYKWSDEWQLLTEGKMRALGANDALLSGDATYSNQETARMFFMERAEALRVQIVNDLFYKKLFPLIARIHGFTKRTKSELDHNIRVNREEKTQSDFTKIPESELIIPSFKWHKDLNNNIDQNKLDVYDLLEEKGVPITLENWAAAGGVKLEDQISDMDMDAELRQRVNEYRSTFDLDVDVEEAKAKAHFVKELQGLSKENTRRSLGSVNANNLGPLNSYLFWDGGGNFGPVSVQDMSTYLGTIDPSSNNVRILADPNGLSHNLINHFEDRNKAATAHFLMYRTGLTRVKPALNGGIRTVLMGAIEKGADKMAKSTKSNVMRIATLAQKETKLVQSMATENKNKALDKLDKVANGVYKSPDRMSGLNLYAGRRKK